jgi:hypothetical protein
MVRVIGYVAVYMRVYLVMWSVAHDDKLPGRRGVSHRRHIHLRGPLCSAATKALRQMLQTQEFSVAESCLPPETVRYCINGKKRPNWVTPNRSALVRETYLPAIPEYSSFDQIDFTDSVHISRRFGQPPRPKPMGWGLELEISVSATASTRASLNDRSTLKPLMSRCAQGLSRWPNPRTAARRGTPRFRLREHLKLLKRR